jgi:hypothetical protein
VKSHPTRYAGVQFRSRLEARWAAFFDLAGWAWRYEPVDDTGWVPDFVLVRSGLPVEVKPIEWPYVDTSDIDRVFAVVREREDLGKVRRSDRPEALVLGAYPVIVEGAPAAIGVALVRYIDGGASEQLVTVTEGAHAGGDKRFDARIDDDFGVWIGSGQPMFRNEKAAVNHTAAEIAWREAGNLVQWRGVAARP